MNFTYYNFAKIYGENKHTRKVMIQGLMYLEFEYHYEPLVSILGENKVNDLMQNMVDFGYDVYMNSDNINPIDIGMAFDLAINRYLYEQHLDEYDDSPFDILDDIEDYFYEFFEQVRS